MYVLRFCFFLCLLYVHTLPRYFFVVGALSELGLSGGGNYVCRSNDSQLSFESRKKRRLLEGSKPPVCIRVEGSRLDAGEHCRVIPTVSKASNLQAAQATCKQVP